MKFCLDACRLSWLPIALLLVGYLCVGVSVAFDWEVPSSGAVLLCCVVIAEIVFSNQRWVSIDLSFTPVLGLKPTENGEFVAYDLDSAMRALGGEGLGGTTNTFPSEHNVSKDLAVISRHARPFELNGVPEFWVFSENREMFKRPIVYLLAISAVVGSLVWAYGHLIWKAAAC